MGRTNHYNLSTIGPGDEFSEDGHKYSVRDREDIDLLLYIGAEAHIHGGPSGAANNPTGSLNFTVLDAGGSLPASVTYFYKYSLISPEGLESAASDEFSVSTPDQVPAPNAASLISSSAGGTLLPGTYYYIITAYTSSTNYETKSSQAAYITIPLGSSTNSITLDLPTLPVGADGWNIYRRAPGGTKYYFLNSFAAGPSTYVDSGADEEDCNRTIPSRNNTYASNSISITTTEVLPAGYTWRIFRSTASGQFENSLLASVVEETTEGSGIITTTYVDVGNGTQAEAPRSQAQVMSSPPAININDGFGVDGVFPMGVVQYPTVVQLGFFPGVLEPTVGTSVGWVCEHPFFKILGTRIALAVGASAPAGGVVADVNAGISGSPPSTIYTTQANRPTILAGSQMGLRTAPPDVSILAEGDFLTFDLDTVSNGATPTAYDMTIFVYGYAYGYPDNETLDPEA